MDELLNARERINKAVLAEMQFCTDQWGIEVKSYEGSLAAKLPPHPPLFLFRHLSAVQNIVVNTVLANAMHAQSGAERQKRARIIESEGERTSIQNFSEGGCQYDITVNLHLQHYFVTNLQANASPISTRARARGNRPSTSQKACALP